jgi:hypothetical protein
MLFRIFIALMATWLFLFASCKAPVKQNQALQELLDRKSIIEKQIQNEARLISDQVSAFSKEVAADRDFAMKLIVENNRSAPEVTDFAQRFMGPMGFSLLEIVDSGNVLLSSAQFPASVGTSVLGKAELLGDQALFIADNIKGRKMLTLQRQIRFKILDASFSCLGGRIIDEDFISRLFPGNGFRLVLKQGDKMIGVNPGESVSDFRDSTIVVGGALYPALSLALPFAGPGEAPVCILINEKAIIHK